MHTWRWRFELHSGSCFSGKWDFADPPKTKIFNPSLGFLQIFYCNLEANLHVIFEWCNTGWTSREEATADAIITGAKKPKVLGSATPWAEIFEVKVNADSWIYTLQVFIMENTHLILLNFIQMQEFTMINDGLS